jgi:hypothetical protein
MNMNDDEIADVSVLDEIYDFLGKYVIHPSEQAKVAHTIWIMGTYFLEDEKCRVFDNFPMLLFQSLDPNSGKSRALETTEALAYNCIYGGSYTTAALLVEIDERVPKVPTLVLDEFDLMMSPTRTGFTELQMLMNLGYQRGKYVVRRHLKEHRNLRTPAFCPKVMAGLQTPRLLPATKSRIITIEMERSKLKVGRHIDKDKANVVKEHIMKVRPFIYERMKDPGFDEDMLSTLDTRNAQIWHPLLAVAKFAGGERWFQRATSCCEFFTAKAIEEDPSSKYLEALYKIYAHGQYRKNIWLEEVVHEFHTMGIDVDKDTLFHCFGAFGLGLPSKQIHKRNDQGEYKNLQGYVWDELVPVFAEELTETKRNELYGTTPLVGV